MRTCLEAGARRSPRWSVHGLQNRPAHFATINGVYGALFRGESAGPRFGCIRLARPVDVGFDCVALA